MVDALSRLLDPADALTAAAPAGLSFVESRPLGGAWLLDGTRMKQLARDNTISQSTEYDYLHEAITVLAAQAPGLHTALLAAKAAGYDYVLLDGTLIETNRIAAPGPTPGVDLWWSKKHKNHGGNIQVLTRTRRLAAVDITGTPRPGTRHHLPTAAGRGRDARRDSRCRGSRRKN